jgi:hypothetical protein
MDVKIFPARIMISTGLEGDYIVVANMKTGEYSFIIIRDGDEIGERKYNIYLFGVDMFDLNRYGNSLVVYKVKPFMKIGGYYVVAANECKWIYLDKPTENIDEAFENAISEYQAKYSPDKLPDCARLWKERGLYRLVIPMYTLNISEVEKWINEYTETMMIEALGWLM